MHKVFVYGSLKEGFGNHALLEDCKKLGEAETKSMFTMVSLHAYPMVFDTLKTSTIKGEVYEVDDNHLKNLDRLEGHPDFYERKMTMVDLEGKDTMVFIYVASAKSSYNMRENDIIHDGVWRHN